MSNNYQEEGTLKMLLQHCCLLLRFFNVKKFFISPITATALQTHKAIVALQ